MDVILVIDGEAIHDDPPSPETSNDNAETKESDKAASNGSAMKKGKKKAVQPKKQRVTRSAKTVATRKRRLRKRKPTSSKGNQNTKNKDPSPVALLDMLAEVASATLKNDPTIQSQIRSSPRACVKAKKVRRKRLTIVVYD